ncbi:MAG: hypothetical protein ACLFUR_05740 [Candidatus Hadarchaeia archaeon]
MESKKTLKRKVEGLEPPDLEDGIVTMVENFQSQVANIEEKGRLGEPFQIEDLEGPESKDESMKTTVDKLPEDADLGEYPTPIRLELET